MKNIITLRGDVNVATLSDVRQNLMKVRLDLSRAKEASSEETKDAIMHDVQETISLCCNKLSLLEGELTNAGIK